MAKSAFTYQCYRCKKQVTDENYFNYGVHQVKYGYTMLLKPLCKDCSEDLDKFLNEFSQHEERKYG